MITINQILEIASKDGKKTDEELFLSEEYRDEETEGLILLPEC